MTTNILFSLPTNDTIEPKTAFKAAVMAQHPNVTYCQVMGSPTDQVRNGLAKMVLENPDYTHLLMMDSDIDPPANIVDLLLECDSQLATALVPICLKGAIVSNVIVTSEDETEGHFLTNWENKKEPFEVEAAGTGCVLIRRDVLETIPWPWFRYQEKYPSGDRIGEDIYFSRKCNKAGIKYKAHPKAVCGHIKKFDLLDIVRLLNDNRKT